MQADLNEMLASASGYDTGAAYQEAMERVLQAMKSPEKVAWAPEFGAALVATEVHAPVHQSIIHAVCLDTWSQQFHRFPCTSFTAEPALLCLPYAASHTVPLLLPGLPLSTCHMHLSAKWRQDQPHLPIIITTALRLYTNRTSTLSTSTMHELLRLPASHQPSGGGLTRLLLLNLRPARSATVLSSQLQHVRAAAVARRPQGYAQRPRDAARRATGR